MIYQIDSSIVPAGNVAYDGGSIYAVRVVSFSSGATIAFDTPKSVRKIYGYFAYRTRKPGGWGKIYLSGTVVIEIATDPLETFDGAGAAGVSAVDGNGNTICVGPVAAGAAVTTAAPVQVAGEDGTQKVQIVPVGQSGQTPPLDATASRFTGVTGGGVDTGSTFHVPYMTASAGGVGQPGIVVVQPMGTCHNTFWDATSDPGSAGTPSCQGPAGAAGLSQVVNHINISLAGTVASGIMTVQLKDGATVIRTWKLNILAGDSKTVDLSDLGIAGTAGNRFTLAFSGATLANVQGAVSMGGIIVQNNGR